MTSPVSAIEDIEAALNEAPICEYPDFTNAVREVLALARQAKALERENAEKDARIADLTKGLTPFARIADMTRRNATGTAVTVNVDRCRDARALLGGENAE